MTPDTITRYAWATRVSADLIDRARQRPSYPGGPRDPAADWTPQEAAVAAQIRDDLLTKSPSPDPQ